MNKIKKAWQWLVLSSANADKISLTVKAFLYSIIPGILFFANLTHIQLDNETLTQIVDGIAKLITYVGGAITAFMFIVGLVRKIWTTATGSNSVVTMWRYED